MRFTRLTPLLAIGLVLTACGGSTDTEMVEVRVYTETRRAADEVAGAAIDEGLRAEVVRPDGPGWSVRVRGPTEVVEDFAERMTEQLGRQE